MINKQKIYNTVYKTVRLNRRSSGPRVVYALVTWRVGIGTFHSQSSSVSAWETSMVTNGVLVSVWCRGCGVGGVEAGETAILQSSTTLRVTFSPFLLQPLLIVILCTFPCCFRPFCWNRKQVSSRTTCGGFAAHRRLSVGSSTAARADAVLRTFLLKWRIGSR